MKDVPRALLCSVVITFALVCVYVLSQLISGLSALPSGGAETGGIAAVAGGASLPGLIPLLVTETIVFLAAVAVLRRKHKTKEFGAKRK